MHPKSLVALCAALILGMSFSPSAELRASEAGAAWTVEKSSGVVWISTGEAQPVSLHEQSTVKPGETVVVSTAQKAKFDNVRRNAYPAAFPLRLMHKDLGLILDQGQRTNAPLPAVAAAAQWFAAEHARQAAEGRDDDMSAIVRALMAADAVRSA